MSDVSRTQPAKRVPLPSDSVHGRLTSAKGGVLDLRTSFDAPSLQHQAAKASMKLPAAAAYVEPHQASKLIAPAPGHVFKAERFEDRFDRARGVPKSQAVSKFHAPLSASLANEATSTAPQGRELPAAASTHHESLTRLLTQLPSVQVPSATSRGSRVLAVAGAVAIMSGYVWLQNYPKMAIQAAGDKAGVVASMPGYVPSSYQLARTSTAPGLVTLQFKTSDQPAGLTISQHRTTWDSGSLLDNFVTRESTQFAAVQKQGLTVYLFDHNQATWVNHGIWYRITGDTRLSREQVLKIAYSL